MKIFVSGLKPEVFREEIYSRAFETLVDVRAETRHELTNYEDIIEISERIKRPELKRDAKDRSTDGPTSRKLESYIKTPSGACFVKDANVSNPTKTENLRDVEFFKYHK